MTSDCAVGGAEVQKSHLPAVSLQTKLFTAVAGGVRLAAITTHNMASTWPGLEPSLPQKQNSLWQPSCFATSALWFGLKAG